MERRIRRGLEPHRYFISACLDWTLKRRCSNMLDAAALPHAALY